MKKNILGMIIICVLVGILKGCTSELIELNKENVLNNNEIKNE